MADQPLPLDILLVVMDFACHRSIAAMMRTCSALYRESKGPRLLLRNGATLATNVGVLAFSEFMFANAPGSRFRYLRTLTVSGGDFSDGVVRRLAAILKHDDLKLESLTLHDAERVLSSGIPVGDNDGDASTRHGAVLLDAFSSLSTLRHLEVSSMGDRTHEFLENLPSALVSVSLDFNSPGAEWSMFGDPDNRNPIVRLARSADTLEVLVGAGFDVRPNVVGYDIVYPRVRRICATYKRSGAMPATAAYVRAFPNIELLALVAHRERILNGDPHPRREQRVTREANRGDQVNYGSWQRLRVVEGTVADVWSLGLVCHVPVLRLLGDLTRGGLARRELEDVLEDVRPASLTLTVVGRSIFGPDGELTGLLSKPVAQCLRTLNMEIVFGPSEGDTDMAETLENIHKALTVLALRTLKLTLNYGILPGAPATDYLLRVDLKRYSRRFLDAMPSLETAAVRRSRDRAAHEYMLGPVGRNSVPPYGRPEEREESGGEEIMQELAELGFGGALDDDDEGW